MYLQLLSFDVDRVNRGSCLKVFFGISNIFCCMTVTCLGRYFNSFSVCGVLNMRRNICLKEIDLYIYILRIL